MVREFPHDGDASAFQISPTAGILLLLLLLWRFEHQFYRLSKMISPHYSVVSNLLKNLVLYMNIMDKNLPILRHAWLDLH